MDSARRRNSTRAGKARPVKPSPKPRRKPAPSQSMKPASAAAILSGVRARLAVVEAVVIVACLALKRQNADWDVDVATTLQRCVVDELDRQLTEIDRVIARCRALQRMPAQTGGAA